MEATAIYSVPGLKLAVCPWCKNSSEVFHLLVYDRNGVTEFEVMCGRCKLAAHQFAEMHQNGISRFDILADFGYRGSDAPWPKNTATQN
jgi:hypothetical protein